MSENPVILFDGVCNLCNNSVQFVIKHDAAKKFRFAALQSDTGQALLKQYNLPSTGFDSFVLIQNDKTYLKSTAALTVAKQLKGIVKLLYIFIIVPVFIRNFFYNFIAKNRYKWFGKQETCMMPTAELKSRFLA
jgi:predicted DCC family thiol-disulfide oxidoreductase YuxK